MDVQTVIRSSYASHAMTRDGRTEVVSRLMWNWSDDSSA